MTSESPDTEREVRSMLTGEWMEDCILERKQRSTRDGEQQLQEQEYLSPNAAAGRAAGAGAFASVMNDRLRHTIRW